jgi:hypothetical protein
VGDEEGGGEEEITRASFPLNRADL